MIYKKNLKKINKNQGFKKKLLFLKKMKKVKL